MLVLLTLIGVDRTQFEFDQLMELEDTTVWSFEKRGDWSTHKGFFRGNWAPQVPFNLIKRYSNPSEIVLVPFLGSGTSLIEAKRLGRKGIGLDINAQFLKNAIVSIKKAEGLPTSQSVILMDSRDLSPLKSNSVDLALLHPPYADAIEYSDLKGDLSSFHSISEFCEELSIVLGTVARVLKPDKIMALMVGDLRRRRKIVPLGLKVLQICVEMGFDLIEIVIKIQHNCNSMDYWRKVAKKLNFLLLAHEYLFIFRNPGREVLI